MENVSGIGYTDDEGQRADDLCAVNGDNISHEAEYADRGELDDHHEDLHDDFIHAVNDICDHFALLTGSKNACAEENSNDDNGQHVGIDHGLEQVIGENVNDNIHDLGSLGSLIFKAGRYARIENREEALETVNDNKADNNSECRGADVVYKGLYSYTADLFKVIKADDAAHNREQNDRDDHKLEKIDVDRTERL